MTNFSVKCPKCGSYENIATTGTAEAYITFSNPNKGSDFDLVEYSHIEIEDDSQTKCGTCSNSGPYSTFNTLGK